MVTIIHTAYSSNWSHQGPKISLDISIYIELFFSLSLGMIWYSFELYYILFWYIFQFLCVCCLKTPEVLRLAMVAWGLLWLLERAWDWRAECALAVLGRLRPGLFMATAGVARGLVISPLEDLGYLGSRKMDLATWEARIWNMATAKLWKLNRPENGIGAYQAKIWHTANSQNWLRRGRGGGAWVEKKLPIYTYRPVFAGIFNLALFHILYYLLSLLFDICTLGRDCLHLWNVRIIF